MVTYQVIVLEAFIQLNYCRITVFQYSVTEKKQCFQMISMPNTNEILEIQENAFSLSNKFKV